VNLLWRVAVKFEKINECNDLANAFIGLLNKLLFRTQLLVDMFFNELCAFL